MNNNTTKTKKALIVVDMQNDFIDGALANPAAADIVEPIAEEILAGAYDCVCLTKDSHNPSTYGRTEEGRNLPIAHCLLGSEGIKIHPTIVEAVRKSKKSSAVVYKETFGSTALLDLFGDYGEVVLVGTCTDICVVSNALLLKTLPNLKVSVIERLCAGTTQENHDAAIKTMRCCHVHII